MSFHRHLAKTDAEHWLTRDGHLIPVRLMNDRHLEATVCMILRWAPAAMIEEGVILFNGAVALCNDDGGLMVIEEELEHLGTLLDPTEYAAQRVPPFRAMLKELAKRQHWPVSL